MAIVRFTEEEVRQMPDLTDWERVRNMRDEDIDCSDIPEPPMNNLLVQCVETLPMSNFGKLPVLNFPTLNLKVQKFLCRAVLLGYHKIVRLLRVSPTMPIATTLAMTQISVALVTSEHSIRRCEQSQLHRT
jgi:hypothetical protein